MSLAYQLTPATNFFSGNYMALSAKDHIKLNNHNTYCHLQYMYEYDDSKVVKSSNWSGEVFKICIWFKQLYMLRIISSYILGHTNYNNNNKAFSHYAGSAA
jgi:hypothetical protein